MRKTDKRNSVPNINVRWTDGDARADWPNRFKKAVDDCGGSHSGIVRMLCIRFTEEVEAHGCSTINTAVEKLLRSATPRMVLNEPSPKYGGKGKKKT